MSPDFQQLMRQATQLTRSGDLAAAQALLQQALGGGAPPAATPFSSAARPAGPAGTAEFDIIDVVARELPDVRSPIRRPTRPDPGPDSESAGKARAPSGAKIHGEGRDPLREPLREPPPGAQTRRGPAPGMTSGHHAAAGLHCDYELFVPPQATAGQPMPLLLMLHGCTQNPRDFAAGTRMNELARAQGWIVLYPAQSKRMNPQGCWNWFKHSHQARGKGEPALLASLVQELMLQHPVDAKRVHVAGLSAGGAMAAILGETYPELFASVGVHSGLAPGAAADLPSALAAMKGGAGGKSAMARGQPVIVFHGDADATVHPRNGSDVVACCTQAAAEPQRIEPRQAAGRSATRRIHRGADGRVLAEHWVVHGAAHAWSGGSPAGSYTDSRGPDASAEMLRFFAEHPQR